MGSAWVDSEAVCGSVGGLHLLLPAAIQTSGLHHRLVGCSQWGIISHFNHINSHLLNLIPLKLIGWLPLNTWNEIICIFWSIIHSAEWVQLASSSLSGMYAGIKFFIIDFIFKRCPKLRQRYDTPYVIWTNLPTDLQLKERSNTLMGRRVSTNSWQASELMHFSIINRPVRINKAAFQ